MVALYLSFDDHDQSSILPDMGKVYLFALHRVYFFGETKAMIVLAAIGFGDRGCLETHTVPALVTAFVGDSWQVKGGLDFRDIVFVCQRQWFSVSCEY